MNTEAALVISVRFTDTGGPNRMHGGDKSLGREAKSKLLSMGMGDALADFPRHQLETLSSWVESLPDCL